MDNDNLKAVGARQSHEVSDRCRDATTRVCAKRRVAITPRKPRIFAVSDGSTGTCRVPPRASFGRRMPKTGQCRHGFGISRPRHSVSPTIWTAATCRFQSGLNGGRRSFRHERSDRAPRSTWLDWLNPIRSHRQQQSSALQREQRLDTSRARAGRLIFRNKHRHVAERLDL